MQLQRNLVPNIARQMAKALIDEGDIEASDAREVALDIDAILNQYLRDEAEIVERARDLVQQRGLAQGEFGRIKRLVADQRGIKIGDDALDYVLAQLLEMLMYSNNVEEVFAADNELKLRMRTFLRGTAADDQKIEAEVRSKLKHVKEGSRLWEIEYARMKEDIKRRRG